MGIKGLKNMSKAVEIIQLAFYDSKYDQSLFAYELDENQKHFTTLPEKAIEMFCANATSYPVVILEKEIPVGFFILEDGKEAKDYTKRDYTMLIRSISVNPQHQGKGYAQQAMQMVPSFVRQYFPQIEELFLLVNVKNARAEHVYVKTGYEDRGIRCMGRVGPQKMLHYTLKN